MNLITFSLLIASNLRLLFCSTTPEPDPPESPFEFVSDLRPVLLHYVEPFLSHATIKTVKMKPKSRSLYVPKLIESMKSLALRLDEEEGTSSQKILVDFSEALGEALNVYENSKLDSTKGVFPASAEVAQKISYFSKQLFEHGEENEKRLFFFDSKEGDSTSHAIVLVVTRHGRHVNLAVINAGVGSQYNLKDKDSLLESTLIPWMEFENVPIEELTGHGDWFAHSILALSASDFTQRLQNRDNDISYYIYGSFLSNLAPYMKGKEKLAKTSKRFPAQPHGTSEYATLMATLLYLSPDQTTFELLRARLGLHLFSEFWRREEGKGESSHFKAALKDAKESQLRAILRTLSAGMARQAVEVWRLSDPSAFALLTNTSEPVKKDALHLPLIEQLVNNSLLLAKTCQAITIDPSTAKMTFSDDLKNLPLIQESFKDWKEPKDLTISSTDLIQGVTFDVVEAKKNLPPPQPLPAIKSLKELQKALNSIISDTGHYSILSSTDSARAKLNEVLLHKVFPIFKSIDGGSFEWFKWIEAVDAKESSLLVETMRTCHSIVLVLFKHTKGRMYLEELLALEQLMLLTWKCAQRFDELPTSVQFGLSEFSAPVSSESLGVSGTLLSRTQAGQTFLDPKLQLSSVIGAIEAESWAWLKRTDEALVNPTKMNFFAPQVIFADKLYGFAYDDLSSEMPRELRRVLEKLSAEYKTPQMQTLALKRDVPFMTSNPHFWRLMEPILKTDVMNDQFVRKHAHFYYPFEMGVMLARMQYLRPMNEFDNTRDRFIWSTNLGPVINFKTYTKKYYPNTKGQLQIEPNDTSYFAIFNEARESDFLNDKLRFFGAFRAAELRRKFLTEAEPFNDFELSSVRIDALLSWIEGNRSGGPFRIPAVYHAIDRMLANHHILADAKASQHRRLLKALFAIIENDLKKFTEVLNTSTLTVRQGILQKSLQTAFVLVRYMHYLKVYKIHLQDLNPLLDEFYAQIYALYWPFLKLKSNLTRVEDADIASVQGLLYLLLTVPPADKEAFLKSLKFPLEDDPEIALNFGPEQVDDALNALKYLHAFIYQHYQEKNPERLRFTDVYNFALFLQQSEIPEDFRPFLEAALKHALFPVFEQDTGKTFDVLWYDEDLVQFQAPLLEAELSTQQRAQRQKLEEAKRPALYTTYWARLSTGDFYRDRTPIITQQVFLKNLKFRLFIGEKFMADALKGHVESLTYQSVYKLANFRDLNVNFVFSIGEDKELRVFRKYEGLLWNWIEEEDFGRSIAERIGLFAFEGRKLYFRKRQEHTYDFVIIGNEEEQHFAKFTIKFASDKTSFTENGKKIDSITLSLPKVLNNTSDRKPINWTVLSRRKDLRNLTFFPVEIQHFAALEKDFATVIKEDGFGPSLLFGPYRHPAAPETPFILRNSCPKAPYTAACFTFLQRPEWSLDEVQSSADGNVLTGALVLKHSADGSRQIFFPRLLHSASRVPPRKRWTEDEAEIKLFHDEMEAFNNPPAPSVFETKPIVIDTAAVFKNGIVPKSREQKMALAYKFLQELMIDQARKMLHPAKNLDHNSELTEEEGEMLRNILFFNVTHLEVAAIRMMALMHLVLDEATFSNNASSRLAMFAEAEKALISGTIDNYFNNLRTIASRLWIHRLFPEIVQSKVYGLAGIINSTHLYSSDGLQSYTTKEEFKAHVKQKLLLASVATIMDHWNSETIGASIVHNDSAFDGHPASILPLGVFLKSKGKGIPPAYAKLMFVNQQKSLGFEDRSFQSKNYDVMDHFNQCILLVPAVQEKILARKDTSNSMLSLYSRVGEAIDQCFKKVYEVKAKVVSLNPQTDFAQAQKIKIDKFNALMALDVKELTFDDLSLRSKSVRSTTDRPEDEQVPETPIKPEFLEKLIGFAHTMDSSTSRASSPSDSKSFFSSKSLQISSVLQDLNEAIAMFTREKLVDEASFTNTEIFGEIEEFAKETHATLSEEEKRMTFALIHLTNYEEQTVFFRMEFLMHAKKSRTFESLYSCYYANSLKCYQRKFPHLPKDKLRSIHAKSHTFYKTLIFMQYLKKIEALAAAKNRQSLLDELQKAQDFNDRFTLPGVLNFEFRSGAYNLKPEQTADLKTLTARTEKGFNSVVLQRMMAAGKTLVLGTLATIIKAREEGTLSMLIPPSSLFASNAASMQARTYQYFKSRGRVLHFKRLPVVDSEITGVRVLKHLEWMSETISAALKNRDYILVSPDSLQSFQNAFIEYLSELEAMLKVPDDRVRLAFTTVLVKLAEIYDIFLTKGSGILDEIDMTMNPKKELNYPTREREGYNKAAAFLTGDLIEFTARDPKIKIACGLDLRGNNQSGLTEDGFKCVQAAWLDYIEGQLEDESSDWTSLLADISEKIPIMSFLRSDTPSAYYAQLNAIKDEATVSVNALIIMKKQIDDFLRDSLKGAVNEHYGPAGSNRPGTKVAVPYLSANTPSASSVFADRWETLNKTLFMTVVNPITYREAQEIIIWLKKQIELESRTKGSPDLSATLANFNLLGKKAKALDIQQCNHEDETVIKAFQAYLSHSTPASIRIRFTHLFDTVIDFLDFPVEQITSNALNMASMTKSIQGYSGTIDNVNCLPHKTILEAKKDHDKNELYNGGIVRKLLLENPETVPVPEVKSLNALSVESLVAELLTGHLNDPHLQALIDVGAFLKNFKNQKVAAALLKLLQGRIKCILYYDEESNLVEFMTVDGSIGRLTETDPDSITKATGCEKGARFTFYDQRHITGSDISQIPEAKAVLTVGPKVLLRDILQGTLRMRQFMTTQQVSFVIIPETRKIWTDLSKTLKVPQTLSAVNLIELGAFNENEKQAQENVRLAYAKIVNEVRFHVLRHLINSLKAEALEHKDLEWICRFFANNRALFIRNIKEDPIAWIRPVELVEPAVALESYLTQVARGNEQLIGLVKEALLTGSEADNLATFLKGQKLPLIAENSSLGTEVEQEVNVAVMVEVDLNLEVEDTKEDLKFHTPTLISQYVLAIDCPYLSGSGRYFWNFLDSIANACDSTSQRFLDTFMAVETEIRIGVEENLVNFIDSPTRRPVYQLFSTHNWEGTHMLYVSDRYEKRLILIGAANAERLINEMRTAPNTQVPLSIVTDLKGNILATNLLDLADEVKIFDLPDIPKSIRASLQLAYAQLLIFNGSLNELLFDPLLNAAFLKICLLHPTAPATLTLLLQRMQALKGKARFLFAEDDVVYGKVLQAANGGTLALQYLRQQEQLKAIDAEVAVDEQEFDASTESASTESETLLSEPLRKAPRSVGFYSKLAVNLSKQELDELEAIEDSFNQRKFTSDLDLFSDASIKDKSSYTVYLIAIGIAGFAVIGAGFAYIRLKRGGDDEFVAEEPVDPFAAFNRPFFPTSAVAAVVEAVVADDAVDAVDDAVDETEAIEILEASTEEQSTEEASTEEVSSEVNDNEQEN